MSEYVFTGTIVDINQRGITVKLDGKKTPILIFNQELRVKNEEEVKYKQWTFFPHIANMPFVYYGNRIQLTVNKNKSKRGATLGEVVNESTYIFKNQKDSIQTIEKKLTASKKEFGYSTIIEPAVVTSVTTGIGITKRINASLLNYEGIEIASYAVSNASKNFPGDIVFVRVDSIYNATQYKLRGTIISDMTYSYPYNCKLLHTASKFKKYNDVKQVFTTQNFITKEKLDDREIFDNECIELINFMIENNLLLTYVANNIEYIIMSNFIINEWNLQNNKMKIVNESIFMMMCKSIETIEVYNKLYDFKDKLFNDSVAFVATNHSYLLDTVHIRYKDSDGNKHELNFNLKNGEISDALGDVSAKINNIGRE